MRRIGLVTMVLGVVALCASLGARAQVPPVGGFGAPAVPTAPAAEPAPDADQKPVVKKRKPKPKPRKKPAGEAKPGAGQVRVINARSVTLRELTLTSKSAAGKAGVVASDLAPGARKMSKLPAKGGCIYSASGAFDDGSTIEIEEIDACKDRTLNLVE